MLLGENFPARSPEPSSLNRDPKRDVEAGFHLTKVLPLLGGRASFKLPEPVTPIKLSEFKAELSSYLSDADIKKTLEAYYYAEKAHKNQFRLTDCHYITHPLYVAFILAQMRLDYQTLMAALLHDVIEDTNNSKHTLRERFEPEVADLVDGVSNLSLIFNTRSEAQASNLQKMFMAMARDIRVILIKLADRLHNMHTLRPMPIFKRLRIAKETLDFYAPIADRLGMDDLRLKFEDLGFQFLHPVHYSVIKRVTQGIEGEQQDSLKQIQATIKNALRADGIDARVTARTKQPYSIYTKTRRSNKSFRQLIDVLALRVIVTGVDTCYRALGVIHNTYKPIANRFKDYIAIPKKNGYQSLHTALFVQIPPNNQGIPTEIQIRTDLMEEMATNGIAAHWLYKSRENSSPANQSRVRDLVRNIVELKEQSTDPTEFIDHLKTDLSSGDVYVFSTDGVIVELPPNATPVDFAYALDPEIGNTCAGCRIDRHNASLSTPLSSGQTVEIITSEKAIAKAEWLSFVITGTARSNIRYTLKYLKRSSSINFGRELMQRALQNFDLNLDDLPEKTLESALQKLKVKDLNELFCQIGIGDKIPYFTARAIAQQADPKYISEQDNVLSLAQPGPVTIRGTEGIVVNYAQCCHPIPGDAVIGCIQAQNGFVIHIETCAYASELRRGSHKLHPVKWSENPGDNFTAMLDVHTKHQKSAIAELAAAVNSADSAAERIELREQAVGLAKIRISMKVSGRVHLAQVIRNLREVRDVVHVHRPK